MDLKCFQIPFNADFLKHLSRLLLKKHSSSLPDLSAILVIFPSKRNKYYFRRELLTASGLNGMFPPVIYSIDELLEKLHSGISPLKKSSQLAQAGFIYKVILENKSRFAGAFNIEDKTNITDFIRFYPFLLEIIKLFDEIEGEDVTFEQLKVKGVYSDYEERISVLEDIYKSSCKVLSLDNLATRGSILKSVIHGESFSLYGKMYKSVYFAGFSFLTELEKRLFSKISGSVADSSFVIHLSCEDSYSKLINRFNLKPENMEVDGKSPEIKIFEAKSDAAQVSFIIESIYQFHKKGLSPAEISVIVPDTSIIPLIVQSFKSHGIPFNITAGIPVKSTPVYTILKSFLNLCNDAPFYHQYLLSFISHPYIKSLTVDGCGLRQQCYALSEFVRANNIVYLSYEENKGSGEFAGLLEFINSSYNDFLKIKNLSGFSAFIREFLQKLHSADSEISGGYFNEYYKTTCNVLNDFEASGLQFSAPFDFFSFFMKLMERTSVNLFGNPFEGVQVMGLLEARNLYFKAKIITSLNEGLFPPSHEKDIFLNSSIRKSAGLPTASDREALYKYMFEELISGTELCYISYKRDASFTFEKSRFVEKLIENGVDKKSVSTMFLLPTLKTIRAEAGAKELNKADFLKQLEELNYSPSMIRDYIECSYRFYLKYILKLKESPEILEELEIKDYGNILHRVMNRFFKIDEFKSGISPELEKRGIKAVTGLIEDEVKKEKNLSAANRLAFELLKSEIVKWAKEEVKLFNSGHRVKTELSEKRIEVEFQCDGLPVKLSGRPDRINSFNGGFFVIDYKVKNLPPLKEQLINESFKEVQLPFYGLLLMLKEKMDYSAIKGLAYFDLKKEFSLYEVASEFAEEYIGSFELFLKQVLKSLFDPEISFKLTSDIKNCRHCAFPGICKVSGKGKYPG